jgi:acyl-CoA synthetase (AMP-forming)/AMP-acid ligase II
MYVTQGFHRALQQHPDRIATHFGDRTRTFREFVGRVARLAAALRSLGMKTGDRVAMLALNSDRYLEYQLAVVWGGGVLNPCNTRWSAAEILYSLDDCGTVILLVDDAFHALGLELREKAATVREVIDCGEAHAGKPVAGMHDYETLVLRHDPMDDLRRSYDDLVGVYYTGGTTGVPKGVMLSHTNLVTSAMSLLAEGIATPGGVYLHAAPMFHLADGGLAMPHWLAGNAHSMVAAFNAPDVLTAIERDRVTDVLLVPTMVQMLVDHPAMKDKRDLGSLRNITYGASPISEAVLERAMAALPGVKFSQAYGMTELSPVATISPPWVHGPEGRKAGKLRSAGRASFNTEVRVVDESDRPVPNGTVGEIIVKGPNVMVGYWNKPELTATAVRDGWMHTGDGGYLDDDGFLFVVDRLKDMIVSGGENVYSGEVENALAQHPAVASCAVIGIPSAEWGEAVHAVVVLRATTDGGATVTAEDLIAHCRALIAGYKRPRTVEFRDALPLSGAGKILKSELRKAFWKEGGRNVA